MPLIASSQDEGHRLRLLYELGDDFERFAPGALLEDAWIGLRNLGKLERTAVVSDAIRVRKVVDALQGVMPYPLRGFDNEERAQAIGWLSAPPHQHGISHQLLPNHGVIVIRLTGPITVEDFDALSATMESQLERRDRIHGVVIHMNAVPTWENMGAFLRQLAFVRALRGKIEKLAIVIDHKLAWASAPVAHALLNADVRHFADDALQHALDWVKPSDAPKTMPRGNSHKPADRIDQAGQESFPASDPPSFNPGN